MKIKSDEVPLTVLTAYYRFKIISFLFCPFVFVFVFGYPGLGGWAGRGRRRDTSYEAIAIIWVRNRVFFFLITTFRLVSPLRVSPGSQRSVLLLVFLSHGVSLPLA